MKSFFPKLTFKVYDIISYAELVAAENANVQKGMNLQIKSAYSIFLMSVRKGAPYSDEWDERKGTYCRDEENCSYHSHTAKIYAPAP